MIEKYRKHIYCQKEFLEDCVSRLINENSREAPSALYFWNEIKQILLSPDIKLYLDYDKDQYTDIIKDIEKRRLNAARKGRDLELKPVENLILEIWNNQQIGNLHLHFEKINISEQEWLTETSEKQNAIFLINEDLVFAQQIQEKYGVIAIGRQDYKKIYGLLSDRSSAIHMQDIASWNTVLSSSKTPGNSLIMVDNYILNDTSSYEENIKRIFEVLLPEKLSDNIIFQILIVTTLRQNKAADLDCKGRFTKLTEIIDAIRPNLTYEIAILKNDGSVFHDRTIITNYAYISCGAGFDIFKGGKSQKTTTITGFEVYLNPHSKWLSDAYSYLIADLYKVYKSAPEFTLNSLPLFIYGKKGNRILDEYKNLT